MTGVWLYILLGLAIVAAQSVETVTGFGATIIALSLGSYLMPVEKLVVTLIVIGIVQSLWLIYRGGRHIEWRLVLGFILPICAAGLIAGRLFADRLTGLNFRLLLGFFVVIVSSAELFRLFYGSGSGKLSKPASMATLFSGGFVHGVFGTGGPLVVFYASREIGSKAAFRATLSILWLLLNIIFIGAWIAEGGFEAYPIKTAALMLPAVAVGIGAGEIIHGRVNERIFKIAVQLVLVVVGVLLIAR